MLKKIKKMLKKKCWKKFKKCWKKEKKCWKKFKKCWKNKKSSLVDRASKVRQTTNNKMKRILNEATWLVNTKLNSCVKYPDSLICCYCVLYL